MATPPDPRMLPVVTPTSNDGTPRRSKIAATLALVACAACCALPISRS